MTTLPIRFLSLAIIAALAIVPTSAFAAVSASIDDDEIVTTSPKPSITGEAEDTKYIRVVIRSEDTDKIVYKRDVRVKEGEWKTRVNKNLKKGEYEVSVYAGKSSRGDALDEATLTVESKKSKSSKTDSKSKVGAGTTLSISSVPLLSGGTTRAGASVPVAYIQVSNQSTKESALEGFTLVQNGTAPTSVITSFATSDNQGGSRTVVNAAFKNNATYIPLAATLAPGQTRIFTLKATLNTDATLNIGKNLMLDVQSVTTAAKISGMFPVRGTTWTLGY